MTRLPTLTGGKLWTDSSYLFEILDDALINSSTNLWFELSLPNKRRKHAEDFHRRKDGFVLSSHPYGPGLFQICVPELMIIRLLPVNRAFCHCFECENWPQRACVGADLAGNDLVEIVTVSAAK